MFRIIRPISVYETETVRIKWTLSDGSIYEQDVTIPPKDTIKARKEETNK